MKLTLLAALLSVIAAVGRAESVEKSVIPLPSGQIPLISLPDGALTPQQTQAPTVSVDVGAAAASPLAGAIVNLPGAGVVRAESAAQSRIAAISQLRDAGNHLIEGPSGDPAQALQKLYGETAKASDKELGIDRSAMDLSIRPQDDLFHHVNGGWISRVKIPADQSSYGAFRQLRDQSDLSVRRIIGESIKGKPSAGTDDQRIADLYRSFMNTQLIESRGLAPLAADLAAIDGIKNRTELPAILGNILAQAGETPVGLGVDLDAKDTSQYIVMLGQSGLGLPDREYYFNDDAATEKIRAKYLEYLARLFTLSGESDAAQKAAAVFALERALAQHQWTNVENRDSEKTYNKIAVAELAHLAPGFDWTQFLRAAGVPDGEGYVDVLQPSYLTGFAGVTHQQPLENWRLYLKARALEGAAPFLPKAFVEASFEYNRTLGGQKKMRSRWKRGVSLVNGVLGEAVGRKYVSEYFPASSKEHMKTLVENLRAAFARRIRDLAWMSDETKRKALEKLAAFTPKIGYPDKWRDYGRLEISPDDLLGNVRRADRFAQQNQLERLGKPVDRDEWLMTPQTVNAYYNPLMNEIVFPAAILQKPFFDPGTDDAVNYGAIGAIIGHEMSHGFDDEGSRFDARGMLSDWWTKADRTEFEARAAKLIEQFDAFEPLPGVHVNGKLTLGENIGDLGGLLVAHEAYRASLHGREPPVMDGLTGDQRFFMGWAQAWREAARDEALAARIATDPHPPDNYRANTVRNVPAFYRAFKVTEGDRLFLPEKDRVDIW